MYACIIDMYIERKKQITWLDREGSFRIALALRLRTMDSVSVSAHLRRRRYASVLLRVLETNVEQSQTNVLIMLSSRYHCFAIQPHVYIDRATQWWWSIFFSSLPVRAFSLLWFGFFQFLPHVCFAWMSSTSWMYLTFLSE